MSEQDPTRYRRERLVIGGTVVEAEIAAWDDVAHAKETLRAAKRADRIERSMT